jgi:hypothetical protein
MCSTHLEQQLRASGSYRCSHRPRHHGPNLRRPQPVGAQRFRRRRARKTSKKEKTNPALTIASVARPTDSAPAPTTEQTSTPSIFPPWPVSTESGCPSPPKHSTKPETPTWPPSGSNSKADPRLDPRKRTPATWDWSKNFYGAIRNNMAEPHAAAQRRKPAEPTKKVSE